MLEKHIEGVKNNPEETPIDDRSAEEKKADDDDLYSVSNFSI